MEQYKESAEQEDLEDLNREEKDAILAQAQQESPDSIEGQIKVINSLTEDTLRLKWRTRDNERKEQIERELKDYKDSPQYDIDQAQQIEQEKGEQERRNALDMELDSLFAISITRPWWKTLFKKERYNETNEEVTTVQGVQYPIVENTQGEKLILIEQRFQGSPEEHNYRRIERTYIPLEKAKQNNLLK